MEWLAALKPRQDGERNIINTVANDDILMGRPSRISPTALKKTGTLSSFRATSNQ